MFVVIITFVVGLGGFAHSIAGSVEVLYLVTTGAASWGAYLWGFMIPAVLGNILGGVVLVAALNQAQLLFRGSNHAWATSGSLGVDPGPRMAGQRGAGDQDARHGGEKQVGR